MQKKTNRLYTIAPSPTDITTLPASQKRHTAPNKCLIPYSYATSLLRNATHFEHGNELVGTFFGDA